MIFTVRQMQEKWNEQNMDLVQMFIDLMKVFDIVNRSLLQKILGKLGYLNRFVSINKSFYDGVET